MGQTSQGIGSSMMRPSWLPGPGAEGASGRQRGSRGCLVLSPNLPSSTDRFEYCFAFIFMILSGRAPILQILPCPHFQGLCLFLSNLLNQYNVLWQALSRGTRSNQKCCTFTRLFTWPRCQRYLLGWKCYLLSSLDSLLLFQCVPPSIHFILKPL